MFGKKKRWKELLGTVYRNEDDLLDQVKALVVEGAKVNHITTYAESPLRVASNLGRFDVIAFLLEVGADADQLGWTDIFHKIAFGDLASVRRCYAQTLDLHSRDFWDRTPWLFSILVGDIDKTRFLLECGSNREDVGRCGKPPFFYAVESNSYQIISFLNDQQFDINAADEFGDTALSHAAELGKTESVQTLLSLGADPKAGNGTYRIIEEASNPEIVDLLVKVGEDINDVNEEVHAQLIGMNFDGEPVVTKEEYVHGKTRRFGEANPEPVREKFWIEMVRSGANSWTAREKFSDTSYKDDLPIWCFRRFGKSITRLPDGRIIEIAGEHEDSYDPDFCIYNDVFLFDCKGGVEIFGYPEEIFPPTDFHSATLVNDQIIVIGNLGYVEQRIEGETPVYSLDINTLAVRRLDTKGQKPGWISRHKAVYEQGKYTIEIQGGKVWRRSPKTDDEFDYSDNFDLFALNLDTLVWKKL